MTPAVMREPQSRRRLPIPSSKRRSIRDTAVPAKRRMCRLEMARKWVRRIPATAPTALATRFPRKREITAKMFVGITTRRPHQNRRTTSRRRQRHRQRRRATRNIPARECRIRGRPIRIRRVIRNLPVREIPAHVLPTFGRLPHIHRARRHRDHRDPGEALRIAGSIVLGGLALLACPRAWADSAEADALFAEAKTAFEAQDYSRARALFERAHAAGMQGPVVHYNIGAAAFRGGDLPRAERAFREVAEASTTPSMTALAHYNLGLVAMQTHEDREARRWFERTVEESPDRRVVDLASRRLSELPEVRAPVFSYYSRAGFGYDDNVSLRSSSIEGTATGVEDSYGELLLAGSYSFGPWRVDAGTAFLEYLSHDEFSQSIYSLGGARVFSLRNWYFEVGASAAQLSLGGDVFERDTAASALASRVFDDGSRLRALVRASQVKGKADFIGLTGDRQEFGLYFDKGWRSWIFGAHARAEINDSEDPLFATRWMQLGTEARYALSPLWGLTAIAALRRIAHPTQSETVAGWNDNRTTLQLGLTRALWKQTQLFVRLEHERNASPVAGYDYDRNWVAASIENWR